MRRIAKKSSASRKARPSQSVLRLRLPATSANLGPAFDAAALAMDFYIEIEARPAHKSEFSIVATGRDTEICGQLENHLILNTYREILAAARKKIVPLALRIENEIPIGKGCGSSAAARLAGIALAVHFGHLRWSDAQIVTEASRREHHPDNASACWLGGLTVARMSESSGTNDDAPNAAPTAEVICIRPKGNWPLLLAVPEQVLSTEEARRVLPARYARADVVANVQNSMLLLAAFSEGRPDLLSAALEDRIHQPYRAALCPLLPALQELKGRNGILGAVLSGAGPSVLIFLDPRASVQRVSALVAEHLRHALLIAELVPTSITLRGGNAGSRR
jgi:homoserine kinase